MPIGTKDPTLEAGVLRFGVINLTVTEGMLMDEQGTLYNAILTGDATSAVAEARAAIDGGREPLEVVNRQMVPAMDEVGRRFELGEYYLPELLLSARAMKAALALFRPLLAQQNAKSAGRVAVGTVKGDLHDIGKNLVSAMLEGAGFEVVDLGVDVPPEKFVDALRNHRVDIVALSALLTVTMPQMKATVEMLKSSGLRDRVKVMIGGAPVTQQYAEAIGVDGYAENATAAVALARQLIAGG